MIKCFLALLVTAMLFANPVFARESRDVTPLDHLPALSGDYFKIESEYAGRAYHIYVRYPENYDADENTDIRYPVVYLLDGDSTFPMLAPQHLFLHYDVGLPEAILVGIAYGTFGKDNTRSYDFSSPASDAKENQGGAAKFHDFLDKELIPAIESKYRADPAKRILVGQSRGGHFVLYSAFTRPDVFWGRIASNPPLLPGRDMFFQPPAESKREDLALVYTSGENDRADLRADALKWFDAWQYGPETIWDVKTVTIKDGTHAANLPDAYRIGMQYIFSDDRFSDDQ